MSAMKCVVFRIGSEKYAIDIQYVNSITDYREVTKVPDVKPEVEGVIDIRGEIIPIINLAKRLGSRNAGAKEHGKIMIIQYEHLNVGFLVDEASRVLEIQTEDIQAPPSMLKANELELIRGILNINQEIVVMLELKHVFDLV